MNKSLPFLSDDAIFRSDKHIIFTKAEIIEFIKQYFVDNDQEAPTKSEIEKALNVSTGESEENQFSNHELKACIEQIEQMRKHRCGHNIHF